MPKDRNLIVPQDAKGKRLDKFLDGEIEDVSRTKLGIFIEKGMVLVSGKRKKPGYHLKGGEKISVKIEEEKKELKPFNFKVKIIYEDKDIIVVDKPVGLTTHPPQPGYNETLVNALLYMKKDLAPTSDIRPGVVHRLDKETSGVMVLAKNQASFDDLVKQFKERAIKKEYQAICWDTIKKDHLNIDLPVARDTKNRLKMKVSFLKAKQALTKVDVLKRFSDSTLLVLKLVTGRMHQIRVHMKFLGYPLVGDKKYGKKDKYEELFLHAHKLGLVHPVTKKSMEFTSPIPKRFKDFIKGH